MHVLKHLFLSFVDWLGLVDVIWWDGTKPYRKYSGDAGLDLFVVNEIEIGPGEAVNVECDTVLSTRRLWFLLTGRSSSLRQKNLFIDTNIIDGGYRDKMGVTIYNVGREARKVERGERVSQVVPFKRGRYLLFPGFLPSYDGRGKNGFGEGTG